MSGTPANRADRIGALLRDAFTLDSLDIEDQSHLHAGHAGAKSGKGHFAVRIVSANFEGHSLIERHRMVYAALGEMMETDIHALSIDARSPEEV